MVQEEHINRIYKNTNRQRYTYLYIVKQEKDMSKKRKYNKINTEVRLQYKGSEQENKYFPKVMA